MKMRLPSQISAMMKNLKLYRLNSIFWRNFLLITTIVLFTLILITNLYTQQIKSNITEEIIETYNIEQKRSADVLDTIITQLSDFAYYVSIDNDLKLLFFNEAVNESEGEYISLRNALRYCKRTFQYVDSVFIYMEDAQKVLFENEIVSLGQMADSTWLPYYEELNERYILRSRCEEDKYPFLLTLLHSVKNAQGDLIGAVVIDVNLKRLNETIGRSSGDLQKFYMVDGTGELLYSNDARLVKYRDLIPEELNAWAISEDGSTILKEENGDVVITTVSSNIKDCKYITCSPLDSYNERMDEANKKLSNIVLVSVFVGICVVLLLTMQSYRPIQRIMRDVKFEDNFIEGDSAKNELQYIARLIQNTRRKNEELNVEISDWISRLGQAQVQALQSQINPHFLFNTLDTINWMLIEQNGFDNKISKAISSLSQLMRLSMNRSSYLVTVKEELEHAQLYMMLMDIRYPGRIKVFWEVPDRIMEEKVVRLCLQPILENAIRHGLHGKRYTGNIQVKGKVSEESLIITIQDDGSGMSADECRIINEALDSEYRIVDKHVGIANVNQRIKIIFGDDYGIRLKPGDVTGLEVALRFPMNIKEEDHPFS